MTPHSFRWPLLLAVFAAAVSLVNAQERIVTKGTTINGRIVRVQPEERLFLVRTPDGKERTLTFTESTRLRLDNRTAKIVDLREGMDVAIVYDVVDDRDVVMEVTSPVVVAAAESRRVTAWRGRVVRILADPSRVIVRGADGKQVTLYADADTKVRVGDRDARLANLAEGTEVVLDYELRPVINSITSDIVAETRVVPRAAAPVTVRGSILRIDEPKNVVVLRTADDKELDLSLDAEAALRLNNRTVKIVDLREGTKVTAVYDVRDGRYIVRTLEGPVSGVLLKAPAAGRGHIFGTVFEGDRPQPAVVVTLYNENAREVGQKKTSEDGVFAFEDMTPGKYKVRSSKPSSNTAGETGVTVEDGKAQEIRVDLFR